MRYIFAILIPPLGILMCKRWVHFAFNLVFWLLSLLCIPILGIGLIGCVFSIVHALLVCRLSSVDKRMDRLVDAIRSTAHAPAPTTPATAPAREA